MTDARSWKKGLSLAFMKDLSSEILIECSDMGIECCELSFSLDRYFNEFKFHEKPEFYKEIAKNANIELASIHLPFSRTLDISMLFDGDRDFIIQSNKALIEAAGRAGVKRAVLHPSSEPITDETRKERMRRSREGILYLKKIADSVGVELTVENLPRTCLCRTSDEMIELLKDTGVSVCFDTNHCLAEDNVHFIKNIYAAGLTISTLHISDYDFIDERHRLPGDGNNNWTEIIKTLEENDYSGPLMYEVSRKPKEREEISLKDLCENQVLVAEKRLVYRM